MLKCVIWGTGDLFQKNIGCIKLHEALGAIQVVGVTSKDCSFSQILGYEVVSKEELCAVTFDLIIVMTDRKNYAAIVEEAERLGFSKDKMVHGDVFWRTDFDILKYMELKKNPPSILANNCWGGITYHSLDLPFRSPLINMSIHEDKDFIKLCGDPQKYMDEVIRFYEMKYNEELGREYPVALCGDIKLRFLHYETLDVAIECWKRRKERMDWNNLFVMMYTENKETAKDFLELPYEKKICFVPFETKERQLCYVNCYDAAKGGKTELWRKVNGMAERRILYYDDVDLLYEGKIRRLAEYR